MSLFALLFLALVCVPLGEIYLLITVGQLIGAPATILIVIMTAVTGAWLLRIQGLQTLARVQESLQRGEMPAVEILAGLILLVSGALLLTPGFFTDALGFLCLFGAVRAALARALLRHFTARAKVGEGRGGGLAGRVIDGEYRREKDR